MGHKKLSKEDVGGGLQLSLIITPFLDFAFQLLAFFIMTYNPSALEGHIDGTLAPPTETAVSNPNQTVEMPNDLPSDSDPDLAEAVLVKVKAVPKGQQENTRIDGQPSRIEISRPGEGSKVVSDSDVSLEEGLSQLKDELKRIANEPGSFKTNIKLEGEHDLKHAYMMQVYDVCKQAGYKNISFVAPKIELKKDG